MTTSWNRGPLLNTSLLQPLFLDHYEAQQGNFSHKNKQQQQLQQQQNGQPSNPTSFLQLFPHFLNFKKGKRPRNKVASNWLFSDCTGLANWHNGGEGSHADPSSDTYLETKIEEIT